MGKVKKAPSKIRRQLLRLEKQLEKQINAKGDHKKAAAPGSTLAKAMKAAAPVTGTGSTLANLKAMKAAAPVTVPGSTLAKAKAMKPAAPVTVTVAKAMKAAALKGAVKITVIVVVPGPTLCQ